MSGLASDLTQNHQNRSTNVNRTIFKAAGYFTSPCHLRLDSDFFKPMHKVVRSGTSQEAQRQEKIPKDFQRVIGSDWSSLPQTPDMAGYVLKASECEKQIVEHAERRQLPISLQLQSFRSSNPHEIPPHSVFSPHWGRFRLGKSPLGSWTTPRNKDSPKDRGLKFVVESNRKLCL